MAGKGFDDIEVEVAPKAVKYHKGKVEYAPPFFTVNVAHVEGMPEWEVVGVNGEVIQLARGEDVDNVPFAFVEVLKKAIASRMVTKKNNDGTERQEWQPYPAIPFQIVAGPYQERRSEA